MRVAMFHRFAVAALVAITAACAPSSAQAASGSVRLDLYKASFIVGVAGGGGSLQFNRHRHPLAVAGVSWGASVGASKAVLVGRVTNIRSAGDVAGVYGAVCVGSAVLRGGKVVRLRNERGAILELRGAEVGLEFSADLSGLVIALR